MIRGRKPLLSDQDAQEILALLRNAQGQNVEALAEEYGVTVRMIHRISNGQFWNNAVRFGFKEKRMARLELTWPQARIDRLAELWGSEMTLAQIGHELGISRCAVGGKAHRLGLPPRGPCASERAVQRNPEEGQADRKEHNRRRGIAMRHRRKMEAESPAKAPVPQTRKEVQPFLGSLDIPFIGLRDFKADGINQCRFIHGDRHPHLSCGVSTRPGYSYCDHHQEICWIRPEYRKATPTKKYLEAAE